MRKCQAVWVLAATTATVLIVLVSQAQAKESLRFKDVKVSSGVSKATARRLRAEAYLSAHKYILDGKEYQRSELIASFVQAAFPHYTWAESGMYISRPNFIWAKNNLAYAAVYERQLPNNASWALEFFKRDKGFPEFDSINRWKQPITIGFGRPFESSKPSQDSPEGKDLASGISKIKEQIWAISGEIEEITGQPVRILNPEDETGGAYAKMRIVPPELQGGYNYHPPSFHRTDNLDNFKITKSKVDALGYVPILDPWEFQDYFLDAIRFTPYAPARVDGYFVPDARNNIDFSMCFVATSDESLIKPLVTECILRSLGLPDVASGNNESILGKWEPSVSSIASKKLTAYDRALLSMLYCKNIKPQMGRYEVMRLLHEEDACFEEISKTVEE